MEIVGKKGNDEESWNEIRRSGRDLGEQGRIYGKDGGEMDRKRSVKRKGRIRGGIRRRRRRRRGMRSY
jgi:hypothetical protein